MAPDGPLGKESAEAMSPKISKVTSAGEDSLSEQGADASTGDTALATEHGLTGSIRLPGQGMRTEAAAGHVR